MTSKGRKYGVKSGAVLALLAGAALAVLPAWAQESLLPEGFGDPAPPAKGPAPKNQPASKSPTPTPAPRGGGATDGGESGGGGATSGGTGDGGDSPRFTSERA
ncbi:MAG: hypothetical protein RLZZ58_382, partial [Pseudomonadota bacterium]